MTNLSVSNIIIPGSETTLYTPLELTEKLKEEKLKEEKLKEEKLKEENKEKLKEEKLKEENKEKLKKNKELLKLVDPTEDDAELLTNIMNHGLTILEQLVSLHSTLNKEQKEKLSKYLKLYLTNENEIFGTNVDNIAKLTLVLSSSKDSNLLTYIMTEFVHNRCYNIICKLVSSFHSDDSKIENKLILLSNMLKSTSVDDYDNKYNIDIFYEFFKKLNLTKVSHIISNYFLKMTLDVNIIYNWFVKILNKNLINMSIDSYQDSMNGPNDILLLNVSCVIFNMAETLIVNINENIDINFVLDKKSPIRWYNNKDLSKENLSKENLSKDLSKINLNKLYNIETKFFFLALNSLRISITPLVTIYAKWDKEFNSDNRKYLRYRYSYAEYVVNSSYVCDLISTMYMKFITYVNINLKNNYDLNDSLRDLVEFYNLDKINNNNTYDNLLKLCLTMITTSTTKSPEIKYSYLKLLDVVMQKKITIDYELVFTSIIMLYLEYKKNNALVADSYKKRQSCLTLIKLYLIEEDDLDKEEKNKDKNKNKDKINKLYSFTQSVEKLIKCNKAKLFLSSVYSDGCWLVSLLNEVENTTRGQRDDMLVCCNTLVCCIIALFRSDVIINLTKSDELLTGWVTMLNSYLKIITSVDNLNIIRGTFVENLIKCYGFMINESCFVKLLLEDTYYFNIKDLEKCGELVESVKNSIKNYIEIINKNKIKDIKVEIIEKEIKEIKEIKENIIFEKIPEELVDPIMGDLLVNPMMIPNNLTKVSNLNNTYVSSVIIRRHLQFNSTNPFTMEYLDLDILEKYNEIDEVKYKVFLLKKKIDKFNKVEITEVKDIKDIKEVKDIQEVKEVTKTKRQLKRQKAQLRKQNTSRV
jgi:hypothetical protein